MSFVHLHTHSHYSLLDGLAKIDQLVGKAKEYNMPALALTDHGGLYGAVEFYKKAKNAGIKPIVGVETYMAPRSLRQKEAGIDSKAYHLVLLAKNEEGYKNLLKLVSISYLEGFYYKPRIDKETLSKYSKGIIGMSACMAGELPRLLLSDKKEAAEKSALMYEEIFGKGNFYIEIMHHPNVPNHELAMKLLVELSKKTGIPLVGTQDIHYLNKDDSLAQDALVAIQTNTILNDTNRLSMTGEDYSFRSPEEMTRLLKETPEAVKNTLEIADKCNLELKLGKWVFPKFEIPTGQTPEEYLNTEVRNRLAEKSEYAGNESALKRLEYELDVINKKGYAPYFLIVADFISHAKSKGIITNTRGSAAGSFVSHLLKISNIDPIKYELPFERFLNPYRPSPPDIDMDFADVRRDEIIEYAKQKYGSEKVAQIGTFGTMMARAAARDITRVMNHEYAIGDRIAKMIPMGSQGFPMTIKKAMELTPELAAAYKNEEKTREILDLAQKLEGSARHVSVHAAGVVISPEPLTEYVPLQREPNGEKIITQYEMHAVEDVGLLKMDFLGIRNLSILNRAVDLIQAIYKTKIDLDNLPLEDKKTYELLARGETMGLFQLGGNGMTKYLKELKPTTIFDIMAMIALFRPGPMDNIPTYISRKHGREKITYPDPRLEKILSKTYGVVTYQDDVLMIAIELAGYNWDTVDTFRKAIGKKIPEVMAQQEKVFIEGCQKHGKLSKQKAEALWKLFDPFKGYGFNKAHAASYAMVAYQTAYLKAHYPAEYMAAVLSAESDDLDKIAEAITECKRMGIEVLLPDINESFADFTVVEGTEKMAIRFGLSAIKNVGDNITEMLISERKQNGKYKSIDDLLDRIHSRDLNKKSLESLARAGAMDALGERNTILSNMDLLLSYHKESKNGKNSCQSSLFSFGDEVVETPGIKLGKAEPMNEDEKLKWEKELLGLYISGHPIDKHKSKLARSKLDIVKIKALRNGSPVITIAMITEIRKIMTKNNEPMAFVKIMDMKDTIEMIVFPRILGNYGQFIETDACVIIKGKVSVRNGETSVIADEIKTM
jgi:DNA polymerase-3 subunit alpha